jgi:hypothetical protein
MGFYWKSHYFVVYVVKITFPDFFYKLNLSAAAPFNFEAACFWEDSRLSPDCFLGAWFWKDLQKHLQSVIWCWFLWPRRFAPFGHHVLCDHIPPDHLATKSSNCQAWWLSMITYVTIADWRSEWRWRPKTGNEIMVIAWGKKRGKTGRRTRKRTRGNDWWLWSFLTTRWWSYSEVGAH